tara:strand:+ start:1102 stop:1284 length:183 start_codon:yes stop_codon:yes gene_type:complete
MPATEVGEYLPCVWCGKLGYTDQRQKVDDGHICVRCARPDINWAQWDKKTHPQLRRDKNE